MPFFWTYMFGAVFDEYGTPRELDPEVHMELPDLADAYAKDQEALYQKELVERLEYYAKINLKTDLPDRNEM